MAEVRTWITTADSDGLTAGELKKYLEHVPDAATMRDGTDAALASVEAVWEISK